MAREWRMSGPVRQLRLEEERKTRTWRDQQTLQSSFGYGGHLRSGKGTCMVIPQVACRVDWKGANVVWAFGSAPQQSRDVDAPGWTVETSGWYDWQDLMEKGSRVGEFSRLISWSLVEFLDGYNINNQEMIHWIQTQFKRAVMGSVGEAVWQLIVLESYTWVLISYLLLAGLKLSKLNFLNDFHLS